MKKKEIDEFNSADAEITTRGVIPKPLLTMSVEQNFRNSLHQFRWGQATPAVTQTGPQPEPGAFSRLYQSMSSYVPLRSGER